MEAIVAKINQMSSQKCSQLNEQSQFLSKNSTQVGPCLCIIKELENVKHVKEKVEKMSNNAQYAKEKALLQRWFKWDQVCLPKWLKIAKNVKEKETSSVKEANVKHAKVNA